MTRGMLDHLIEMARDAAGQLEMVNETFAELSADESEFDDAEDVGQVDLSELDAADSHALRALELVERWVGKHWDGGDE